MTAMNNALKAKLYGAGVTSPDDVIAAWIETSKQAWRDMTRVSPVDPLWTREVSIYASVHNLDWRDARDILEARRYAVQETMDGRYPSANGGFNG